MFLLLMACSDMGLWPFISQNDPDAVDPAADDSLDFDDGHWPIDVDDTGSPADTGAPVDTGEEPVGDTGEDPVVTDDTGEPCEERTWYQDLDGDGFGNPDVIVEACDRPDDYVSVKQDCDDDDASVNPWAIERRITT